MSRHNTRVSALTTLIEHSTRSSSQGNEKKKKKQKNKIEVIQVRQNEIKLSLFADDMIVYIESTKQNITPLELVSGDQQGHRIQDKQTYANQLYFYILAWIVTLKNVNHE